MFLNKTVERHKVQCLSMKMAHSPQLYPCYLALCPSVLESAKGNSWGWWRVYLEKFRIVFNSEQMVIAHEHISILEKNNSSEMEMNENEWLGVNYCLNSLRISLKSANKKDSRLIDECVSFRQF